MSEIDFRRLVMLPLLSTVAFAGCGEPPPEGAEEVSGPIINGATVATDNVGTPMVTSTDGGNVFTCTGTMVGPKWMLTAHHCVTQGSLITGGTALAPGNVTATLRGGAAVAGSLIIRHPTLDAALVLLSAVPRNGAGRTFVNRFYKGPSTGLVSRSFYTQGWGNNAITQCSPSFGGTGAGTLRSATLPVTSIVDATHFQITPNASNQIEWTGDSGSSLFSVVSGFNRPNGVESTGSCTSNPSLAVTAIQDVRGDAIRSWVEGITGNAPSVGRMVGLERADDGTASVPYHAPDNRIKELCFGGQCGGSWHFGNLSNITGAPVTDSDVTSYLRSDAVTAVDFRTSLNHIWELRLSGGTNWVATDVSSLVGNSTAVGNPAAYTRSDNFSAVVFRDNTGHVRELGLVTAPSTWQIGDLTGLTGASLAVSDPVGYVRADATNAVVFRSGDGHVQELNLGIPVTGWGWADLSALTGAPAATGTPRPYTRVDGWSVVTFRGTDSHIYELGLAPGSSTWQVGDLTVAAGAVLAASDPAPYVRYDRWNAVAFRGTDNHIYELELPPVPGAWQVSDLTRITGSPLATGTPSGYARPDNVSVVNFQTSDNHVHELSLSTGSSWNTADLSAIVGGV